MVGGGGLKLILEFLGIQYGSGGLNERAVSRHYSSLQCVDYMGQKA